MTKRQDLCLQRRSRPEQSDQRQANQPANISHQPRASPDSTSLASWIELPTMTALPAAAISTASTNESPHERFSWTIVITVGIDGNQRYSWTKNQRSWFVRDARSFRRKTIT